MQATPAKSSTTSKIAKILVAVAVFIWAAIAAFSLATPSKEETAPKSSSKSVGVGQDGIIRTGIAGGVTKDDFDELTKAATAKDEAGFGQLIASGRAIVVDNNTKVKVIDTGLFKKRVRLLTGDHAGAAVWVASEHVESE